jgi:hypothetical protein
MYPEEYTESLKYQYCRSPHYLKPEIMNNKEISPRKQNGNVEFLWEGNTTRKLPEKLLNDMIKKTASIMSGCVIRNRRVGEEYECHSWSWQRTDIQNAASVHDL